MLRWQAAELQKGKAILLTPSESGSSLVHAPLKDSLSTLTSPNFHLFILFVLQLLKPKKDLGVEKQIF